MIELMVLFALRPVEGQGRLPVGRLPNWVFAASRSIRSFPPDLLRGDRPALHDAGAPSDTADFSTGDSAQETTDRAPGSRDHTQ